MSQNIEFEGVVDVVKLRNPHMAMTLVQTNADGSKATINFVEGAPANMIVRLGLNPDDIAPGKKIKAIGAPRRDNPTRVLPEGRDPARRAEVLRHQLTPRLRERAFFGSRQAFDRVLTSLARRCGSLRFPGRSASPAAELACTSRRVPRCGPRSGRSGHEPRRCTACDRHSGRCRRTTFRKSETTPATRRWPVSVELRASGGALAQRPSAYNSVSLYMM